MSNSENKNHSTKIKEFATVYDGPHATPKKTKFGPYYLGINAITESGKIDLNASAHLSEEDYIKWTKRITPQEDDIVFSYEATLGRYAMIPAGFVGSLGRRLAIVRVNSELVNPRWLYYYFYSPTWKKYMANRIVYGSTVNRISVDEFPEYEVELIDRKKQDDIVYVLSAIDDEVSNNDIIAQQLEAMAKTIYDYWFLQFEFPNEEGKPYKSSGGKMVWNEELQREIPAGWNSAKLKDVIIENPKSKIKVGDVKDDGEFPFFTSGANILATSEPIVSGMNCYLNTGGNADVKYYYGEASYSTDTWCITAEDEMKYILPFILDKIKPSMDKVFFQGTGLRHLQKNLLREYQLCIPDERVVKEFTKVVRNIFKQQHNLLKENKELESLKQFLLPLLMNGQVSVGEKE